MQNVFSKKLLSTHYNYINLQFYTSAAALTIQLPVMLYNHAGKWWRQEHAWDSTLALHLLLNGGAFHLQSVMAYAVMGLISPVSQVSAAFFTARARARNATSRTLTFDARHTESAAPAQSVANTLKRALLIWLSILYFGNPVTWLSALGTVVCIGGVFAYNHARRVYPYKPPEILPGGSAR